VAVNPVEHHLPSPERLKAPEKPPKHSKHSLVFHFYFTAFERHDTGICITDEFGIREEVQEGDQVP